ncbi:MAG: hypothetical protein U0235_06485 [Polyangiaceae bacterium]
MKFRTEANTYFGRISAARTRPPPSRGSPTRRPTRPSREEQPRELRHDGVGTVDFVVVRDAADAARIATEPAFAGLRGASKLEGDHCYYVGFENVAGVVANPLTASYWSSAPDDCGTQNGTPDCYYLGIDFNHISRRHDGPDGGRQRDRRPHALSQRGKAAGLATVDGDDAAGRERAVAR